MLASGLGGSGLDRVVAWISGCRAYKTGSRSLEQNYFSKNKASVIVR